MPPKYNKNERKYIGRDNPRRHLVCDIDVQNVKKDCILNTCLSVRILAHKQNLIGRILGRELCEF